MPHNTLLEAVISKLERAHSGPVLDRPRIAEAWRELRQLDDKNLFNYMLGLAWEKSWVREDGKRSAPAPEQAADSYRKSHSFRALLALARLYEEQKIALPDGETQDEIVIRYRYEAMVQVSYELQISLRSPSSSGDVCLNNETWKLFRKEATSEIQKALRSAYFAMYRAEQVGWPRFQDGGGNPSWLTDRLCQLVNGTDENVIIPRSEMLPDSVKLRLAEALYKIACYMKTYSTNHEAIQRYLVAAKDYGCLAAQVEWVLQLSEQKAMEAAQQQASELWPKLLDACRKSALSGEDFSEKYQFAIKICPILDKNPKEELSPLIEEKLSGDMLLEDLSASFENLIKYKKDYACSDDYDTRITTWFVDRVMQSEDVGLKVSAIQQLADYAKMIKCDDKLRNDLFESTMIQAYQTKESKYVEWLENFNKMVTDSISAAKEFYYREEIKAKLSAISECSLTAPQSLSTVKSLEGAMAIYAEKIAPIPEGYDYLDPLIALQDFVDKSPTLYFSVNDQEDIFPQVHRLLAVLRGISEFVDLGDVIKEMRKDFKLKKNWSILVKDIIYANNQELLGLCLHRLNDHLGDYMPGTQETFLQQIGRYMPSACYQRVRRYYETSHAATDGDMPELHKKLRLNQLKADDVKNFKEDFFTLWKDRSGNDQLPLYYALQYSDSVVADYLLRDTLEDPRADSISELKWRELFKDAIRYGNPEVVVKKFINHFGDRISQIVKEDDLLSVAARHGAALVFPLVLNSLNELDRKEVFADQERLGFIANSIAAHSDEFSLLTLFNAINEEQLAQVLAPSSGDTLLAVVSRYGTDGMVKQVMKRLPPVTAEQWRAMKNVASRLKNDRSRLGTFLFKLVDVYEYFDGKNIHKGGPRARYEHFTSFLKAFSKGEFPKELFQYAVKNFNENPIKGRMAQEYLDRLNEVRGSFSRLASPDDAKQAVEFFRALLANVSPVEQVAPAPRAAAAPVSRPSQGGYFDRSGLPVFASQPVSGSDSRSEQEWMREFATFGQG